MSFHLGDLKITNEKIKRMKDLKKVLIICYCVQATQLLLFIIHRIVLLNFDIVLLPIVWWNVPIIFMINFIITNLWFMRSFKEFLKKYSLHEYGELFNDSLFFNSFKYMSFQSNLNSENEIDIKIRYYLKLHDILIVVVFFVAVSGWVLL